MRWTYSVWSGSPPGISFFSNKAKSDSSTLPSPRVTNSPKLVNTVNLYATGCLVTITMTDPENKPSRDAVQPPHFPSESPGRGYPLESMGMNRTPRSWDSEAPSGLDLDPLAKVMYTSEMD